MTQRQIVQRLVAVWLWRSLDSPTSRGSRHQCRSPDRAFQDKVDHTLTNQSDGDFRGQDLANILYGAVGRGADFRTPICRGDHDPGAAEPTSAGPTSRPHGPRRLRRDRSRNAVLSGIIASGSSTPTPGSRELTSATPCSIVRTNAVCAARQRASTRSPGRNRRQPGLLILFNQPLSFPDSAPVGSSDAASTWSASTTPRPPSSCEDMGLNAGPKAWQSCISCSS